VRIDILKSESIERRKVEYIEGLKTDKSRAHFEIAKTLMPGGTSSNARSFPLFEPYYVVMDRGKGSHIWDVDGNEYIDYSLSYGPLILGHCHPKIVEAVKAQVETLHMCETATELELKVAKKFRKWIPCAEMVRFGNTGTEATMQAMRIARGYTGKNKVVKFEGQYHGTHDYVLWSTLGTPLGAMGSEKNPNKVPGSWGIPPEVADTMIILPWNNSEVLEKTLRRHANEIAAVLTEPIMHNIGVVEPEPGYLQTMRELTEENDIVLIWDEVVTGFRHAAGGAQELFGITPDMATYAKAMGGGLPISAIAGKEYVMETASPGKVLHGGTYNGNPLCLAAADATITELTANDCAAFKHMKRIGEKLLRGHQEAIQRTRADALVQGKGPVLQLYFTGLKKVRNYRDYCECDPELYRRYQKEMAKRGVWFGPEVHFFISAVHSDDDANKTSKAVEESLGAMKGQKPATSEQDLSG
jgi:glutamate-1-semialdehyde 2,1-aminomutase